MVSEADYANMKRHRDHLREEMRIAMGERDEARVERDRLRAENEKQRWALEEACSDAWTDGEGAVQQYMRRAESRPESDEEVAGA